MQAEKKRNYQKEALKLGFKVTTETIKIPDNHHPIQSIKGANIEINLKYEFLGFSFRRNKFRNFKKNFENQAEKIFKDIKFNGENLIIPPQHKDYFFIGISLPPTAKLALNKLKALQELSTEFRIEE